MISAFEAKGTSRKNYERIQSARFDRLVRDSERRVEEAVESGLGYIAINHELEEFDELCKHFNAFGYEVRDVKYSSSCSSTDTKYYLVWDEERFDEEIIVNGDKEFFEDKRYDNRKSKEIPF